jgi:hypothetical protein
MRRLLYMVAAAAMVMALTGTSASAWRDVQWCADDPAFHLLGRKIEVVTRINSPAWSVANVTYDVVVPSNAGKVNVTYPGGKKVPTTVNVMHTGAAYDGSSFTVRVTVTAGGLTDRTIEVSVSGRGVTSATYTGLTNTALAFDIDATTR